MITSLRKLRYLQFLWSEMSFRVFIISFFKLANTTKVKMQKKRIDLRNFKTVSRTLRHKAPPPPASPYKD